MTTRDEASPPDTLPDTRLGAPARSLRGRDLRYLLAHILWSLPPNGSATVAELVGHVQGLAPARGFQLGPRPSKQVSDALRWEIAHGRVHRTGWGRYEPGTAPRQTRAWIRDRVHTLTADR